MTRTKPAEQRRADLLAAGRAGRCSWPRASPPPRWTTSPGGPGSPRACSTCTSRPRKTWCSRCRSSSPARSPRAWPRPRRRWPRLARRTGRPGWTPASRPASSATGSCTTCTRSCSTMRTRPGQIRPPATLVIRDLLAAGVSRGRAGRVRPGSDRGALLREHARLRLARPRRAGRHQAHPGRAAAGAPRGRLPCRTWPARHWPSATRRRRCSFSGAGAPGKSARRVHSWRPGWPIITILVPNTG